MEEHIQTPQKKEYKQEQEKEERKKIKRIKYLVYSVDLLFISILCTTIYLSGILFPNVFMDPELITESMKVNLTLNIVLFIVITILVFIVDLYLHYRTKRYFISNKEEKEEGENA
jgi:NADH:ubiquinone oxidoreductase subunit 5 (subunit L)/multisubunit Na+/H+ antiporter MnhA subunit